MLILAHLCFDCFPETVQTITEELDDEEESLNEESIEASGKEFVFDCK